MGQRVALVTGANKGIGFEVSRQLAKKGYQVILTSRQAKLGQASLEKLKGEGMHVDYCQLDVADQKSVDLAFVWVRRKYGRLDVLINNAGIAIDAGRDEKGNRETADLFNSDLNIIKDTLETNTFGTLRMIKKFAPLMKINQYGRIVNVSSGLGQLSEMTGGWPGYRISKTTLNAITRMAAVELRNDQIFVNSVCPGWVQTDMGSRHADLSIEDGSDTIVWLATQPDGGPSGGFYRQRQLIEW